MGNSERRVEAAGLYADPLPRAERPAWDLSEVSQRCKNITCIIKTETNFDWRYAELYCRRLLYRVEVVVMQYINQIALEYEGVFHVLANLVGIAGVIFGVWRYLRERKAQQELKDRKRELDQALLRLKHLENFATDLKQYSAAV